MRNSIKAAVKNTTLDAIVKMMGEYIKETETLLKLKGKTADLKAQDILVIGRQIMTDIAAYNEKNGLDGKYYEYLKADGFRTRNYIFGAYKTHTELKAAETSGNYNEYLKNCAARNAAENK